MFDIGFPRDWSSLKKLIWLKAINGGGGGAGIWKTVTGTLIHITDALASPMRKCEVTLEPIQDLHGQDSPYPAGGGKNKIDYDTAYASFKVSENKLSGNSGNIAAVKTYIPSDLVGKQLTFSANIDLTGTSTPSYYRVVASVNSSSISGNAIAAGYKEYSFVTFTPTSTDDFVQFTWGSGSGTITISDLQLEAGGSRTPWKPFANICPITGWTGANAYVTGVNVWDGEWEVGDYTEDGEPHSFSSRIRTKNPIPCLPSTSYYYVTTGILAQFFYYDINDDFISTTNWRGAGAITTPNNCRYIRFYLVGTDPNVGINYPSTDHDYHAYSGTTLSVTFPALGKNLFDGTLVNGIVGRDGIYSSSANRITSYKATLADNMFLKVGTYTLSASNLNYGTVITKDSDGTIIDNFATAWSELPLTFTTTKDSFVFFSLRKSSDANISADDFTAQVEKGSQATSYEPYTNTVYGGKYEFVGGSGESKYASVDLGTLYWTYMPNDNVFRANPFPVKNQNVICSQYKTIKPYTTWENMPDCSIQGNNDLIVKDTRYTDAASFKTAMSGVQLVYELATPTEIQLTPQEISTLAGENNVLSNGDSVKITYKAQAS